MPNREVGIVRRRILASAANLFSKGGYHGTSTRNIARLAKINEATIYRYFACKRDLFLAVLESELQTLQLRGDLLTQLTRDPDLLRLLQFASLN